MCRALGNHDMPFKVGRGVTQGGPLSGKLFIILVDAVAPKWLRELQEDGDYKEKKIAYPTATFFAIFNINYAYLSLRDAGLL